MDFKCVLIQNCFAFDWSCSDVNANGMALQRKEINTHYIDTQYIWQHVTWRDSAMRTIKITSPLTCFHSWIKPCPSRVDAP